MRNGLKRAAALVMTVLMLLTLLPNGLATEDNGVYSPATVPGLSDGGVLLDSILTGQAEYTVTFVIDEEAVAAGAIAPDPILIAAQGTLSELPQPAWSGEAAMAFAGWSVSGEAYVPFDLTAPIAADVTLYAVWDTPVVLTGEANGYTVRVTCGADAQLPEGTELSVTPVSETALEYLRSSILSQEMYSEIVNDCALDIKLVHEGQEIEPAAPVTVEISGLDASGADVFHFAGTTAASVESAAASSGMRRARAYSASSTGLAGSRIDASADASGVRFEADGFSVYYVCIGNKAYPIEIKDNSTIYAMPGASFYFADTIWVSNWHNNWDVFTVDSNTVKVSIDASLGDELTLGSSYYDEEDKKQYECTVTVIVGVKDTVIEGALKDCGVWLTVKQDASEGIPAEPGDTSGAYYLIKAGYEFTDSYNDVFASSANDCIEANIKDNINFVTSIDGSATYGVSDQTGAHCLAVLKNIGWKELLKKLAGEANVYATDGNKLTMQNMNSYKVIPYVVKYKSQSFMWHIDCAVVPTDNIILAYDINFPEGYITDDSLVLPNSEQGTSPLTSTVGAIKKKDQNNEPVEVNETLIYEKGTNGEPCEITFLGWSTDPYATTAKYKPGDEISIDKNTTLYGVWRGKAIPGTLTVRKTVQNAVATVPAPAEEVFTFTVSFDKTNVKDEDYDLPTDFAYEVYTDNIKTDAGTIKNDGTITLKANQSARFVGLKHGVGYTVTETNIPECFTQIEPAAGTSVTGAITGAQNSLAAFTNEYRRTCPVTIEKQVTGNMGDRSKSFSFTVISDKPLGAATDNEYTLTEDGKTATFDLIHGENVVLNDVWAGGTLTITEDADKASGYTITSTATATETKGTFTYTVANTGPQTVTVTNHKDASPDTGILLDSLPYILILALVIGIGVVAFLRKRRDRDD